MRLDTKQFSKSDCCSGENVQEPVLFAMSVAENIAYGLPDVDVSQEDILEAARAANAHDFVTALPQVPWMDCAHGNCVPGGWLRSALHWNVCNWVYVHVHTQGYRTLVGERGSLLSGGQRQVNLPIGGGRALQTC